MAKLKFALLINHGYICYNINIVRMYRLVFLLFVSLLGLPVYSAEGYMFRLYLKDKGISEYNIAEPEQFLSVRSIERRNKQQLEVDSTDLPISPVYIKQLEELGYDIAAKSRWMNTISVHCQDSLQIEQVDKLGFVDSVLFVWKKDTTEIKKKRVNLKKIKKLEKPQSIHGHGYEQLKIINGETLHQKGFKGKGLEIAVIDAGYKNFKNILLLDNVIVKGQKDFVYQGEDMFESSDHGLKVLSVIAANRPDIYVGTAPEAAFWLLRSEDSRSEYPIEEDYWVAAAEYADSVGVDIINTSLGYTNFNLPARSYTHEQLDGKTSFITQAAGKAVEKGIFVEVSAGNEGGAKWHKIAVPSDAENVLTVGSIKIDSLVSYFSSRGPTADGRIKPDVVALGSKISVIASDGEIERSDGTSFAGPVMSGIVACLWQAYPQLTNLQLLDIIRKSSHRYEKPNNSYGYGIPDMKKAMEIASLYINEINNRE